MNPYVRAPRSTQGLQTPKYRQVTPAYSPTQPLEALDCLSFTDPPKKALLLTPDDRDHFNLASCSLRKLHRTSTLTGAAFSPS